MEITAPTPKIMPSIVSRVRSLCAARLPKLMRISGIKTRTFWKAVIAALLSSGRRGQWIALLLGSRSAFVGIHQRHALTAAQALRDLHLAFAAAAGNDFATLI